MWKNSSELILRVELNEESVISQIAKIEALESELSREVAKLRSMISVSEAGGQVSE